MQQTQNSDPLSAGAVAGIIVGVILGLGLMAFILLVIKHRSGGRLFSFKMLRNEGGFDNAAYDRTMDTVKINGSLETSKNGHSNGSVQFQDFDHPEENA